MNYTGILELETCEGVVLYSPLSGEVDPLLFLPLCTTQNRIVLPCDAHADISESVDACNVFGYGRKICVFIPGTAFDMSGTRHGRGGGWYDRFLAGIPHEWIRIGVTTVESFVRDAELTRQPWDEPVDYILVFNADAISWRIYEATLRRHCIDM